MENLRKRPVELREVVKIGLGKAVAIRGLQFLRQADDDFCAVFGPVVSFENLFADTLPQEPVTLNERHVDRGVGILPGTVDDLYKQEKPDGRDWTTLEQHNCHIQWYNCQEYLQYAQKLISCLTE